MSDLVPIGQRREVVPASMRVPVVADELQSIQAMTSPGPSRLLRRGKYELVVVGFD